MKTTSIILTTIAAAAIMFTACRKNEQTARMTVKMTDTPADFIHVNVDVLSVEVNHDGAWITLPTNAGVYDLLSLQNGMTTVLAQDAEIPAGKINQVRLVLGNSNTIETGRGIFPLTVPSGAETGLKLNVDTEIAPDKNIELLIDFDAAASVVVQGNASYQLKPHLELKAVSQF